MKKFKQEEHAENLAQQCFGYGTHWHCLENNANWHGFNVVNIKSIKVIFNRAYRIKFSKTETAI